MKFTWLLFISLICALPMMAQQEQEPIPLVPLADVIAVGLRYGEDETVVQTMNLAIAPDADKGVYAMVIPYLGRDAILDSNYYADTFGRTVNVTGPPSVCDNLFEYGYGHGDGNATTSPLVSEFVEGDAIFEMLTQHQVVYDAPYADVIQDYIDSGYHFHFIVVEKSIEDYPFEVYIVNSTIRYRLLDDGQLTVPLAIQYFHQQNMYDARVVISDDISTGSRMGVEGYPIVKHDIENASHWKTHPFNFAGLGGPVLSGWDYIAELTQDNIGKAVVRYAGESISGDEYVTTFDTVLSPEQSADWTLVPMPDLPDFASVDLTDRNPIYLHQCTSETATTPYPEIADDLPTGRTFIQISQSQTATLIHPLDWQVSPVEILDITGFNMGYVISPDVVDQDDLIAFMDGDDTPPMLLVMQQNYYMFVDDMFRDLFDSIPERYIAKAPYPNSSSLDEYTNGLLAYLLVSDEQYDQNPELFDAMLQHYETYRYWLHPELEHTAYLNFYTDDYSMSMLFGYPEGMYPDIDIESDGTITLYDAQDTAQVIIETIQVDAEPDIEQRYGEDLDDDGRTYLETQGIDKLCELEPNQIVPIVKDGKDGYLTVNSDVHIIYKADDAAVDDSLLEAIVLSSSRDKFYECPQG